MDLDLDTDSSEYEELSDPDTASEYEELSGQSGDDGENDDRGMDSDPIDPRMLQELERAAEVDRVQRRLSLSSPPVRRTRQDRRDEARQEPPSIENCTWRKASPCCKGLKCSDNMQPAQVLAIRHHYKKLRPTDRRCFLKSRMEVIAVPNRDKRGRKRKRKVKRTFFVDGTAATLEMPLDAITHSMLKKCYSEWFMFVAKITRHMIDQPNVPGKERLQTTFDSPQRETPGENAVLFWLLRLSKYYQVSPDSEKIALPFATKRVVHGLFEDEREELDLPEVKYSHFCGTWRQLKELEDVVLRKYLRFAKCDDCVGFRTDRAKTNDPQLLDGIRRREWAHKCMVKAERGSYWLRRKRACVDPRNYISIILDGADQKDFAVPHFREIDHTSQGAHRIPVKIMGVLVHGVGAWAYTHLDHVKQGNNATIDCLVRTLVKVQGKQGFIGRKLYLQLDNTVKQCKSRYMLGFLGMLVHHGVFQEIVLSFLPVGHTHEVQCLGTCACVCVCVCVCVCTCVVVAVTVVFCFFQY